MDPAAQQCNTPIVAMTGGLEPLLKIDELDLAAAVITATGQQPILSNNAHGLQTFTFTVTPAVTEAVTAYLTNELNLPAKRLLACRGKLYRQIRGSR